MASGESEYLSSLRGAVRGYWSGALDSSRAFNVISSAAERRLTQAWREGAAECGILPDELTPDEQLALANAIADERKYVQGMLDRIVVRDDGGLLREAFSAANLGVWGNRYRDLRNRAKVMACADQKLEWVMGATEEHCRTCPRLHGKVKRGSFWARNVQPQNPPNDKLECQGFRCQCELRPTDKPVSRGPLPKLP